MFIDSHTHLDHIYNSHPGKIEWLKSRSCLPISWSFGLNIENKKDLISYLEKQSDIIHFLNKQDFKCYFLAGIHPRNITSDLKPDDIEKILTPFLNDKLCLGLGEIGLESADNREKEILSAQLALADKIKLMGKKIGIHTPRMNKADVTQKLLTLLNDFPDIAGLTVIDHCSPEIIGSIMDNGYHAGITISPVKTSLSDLKEMTLVFQKSIDKMMCNTDSGTSFYETIYELTISEFFSDEIKQKLTFENAYNFFLK